MQCNRFPEGLSAEGLVHPPHCFAPRCQFSFMGIVGFHVSVFTVLDHFHEGYPWLP